jgi:hypothetical protein
MSKLRVLERAFELARSGECAGVQDIKARLKAEHFTGIDDQLYGPSLVRQLKQLCDAARRENARLEETDRDADGTGLAPDR